MGEAESAKSPRPNGITQSGGTGNPARTGVRLRAEAPVYIISHWREIVKPNGDISVIYQAQGMREGWRRTVG
jgi:hypothetical protein